MSLFTLSTERKTQALPRMSPSVQDAKNAFYNEFQAFDFHGRSRDATRMEVR